MEYKIEVYNSLCPCAEFTINGIDADEDDFVDQYDHCGNMRADIKAADDAVLKRYGITADEYAIIAADVAKKVSCGCCGVCT